jgi:hypothetical protein
MVMVSTVEVSPYYYHWYSPASLRTTDRRTPLPVEAEEEPSQGADGGESSAEGRNAGAFARAPTCSRG